MKLKVLIAVAIIALIAFAGYTYINREHRDIATVNADYKLTAQELSQEFQKSEEEAVAKYLNKVIEVQGTISTVSENVLELTPGVSVQLKESLSAAQEGVVKKDTQVSLRARCIGYDSLLEEVRLDQAFLMQ